MYLVSLPALVLCCVCVSLVQCQADSELHCAAPRTSATTKAHVTSRQNQTGHWIAEVNMEHLVDLRSKQKNTNADPWGVSVEHSSTTCSGTKSVQNIKFVFTAKPQRVGSDYKLFPHIGYYKFHVDSTSWSRAREICAEEGAHLAIINSVEEAEALKQLYLSYPKFEGAKYQDWAWIGLLKNGTDGDFITIFDEPISATGFTKWHAGVNPKAPGNLLRAVFHRTLASLSYDTDEAKCAFICEQELW